MPSPPGIVPGVHALDLAWEPDGPSGQPELRIRIDAVDLVDLVAEVERPHAAAEGHPDIAGGYAGLAAWRLRGTLREHFLGGDGSHLHCGPHDKTVLLGCDCGEPGCWPLMARVDVTAAEVRWDAFEQPHRRGRWTYEGLGFAFDREAYEAALARAAASTPVKD